MSLSNQEIKEILAAIAESGWDEAHVTIGDVSIVVSKDGPPGAVASPAPATPSAAPALPPARPVADEAPALATPADGASPDAAPGDAGVPVESPVLGVFYRAPQPGAAPFVEVGDRVDPGDVLCIVEVMKLMNQIVAEFAGVVTAIHVQNGELVENGSPLMSIEPA